MKMLNKYLFVVFLFHGVLSDGSDDCVRYDFEDFDNTFPRDVPRFCGSSLWIWYQGNYDNSTIAAVNEMSKWFIYPVRSGSDFACTASFLFTIGPGGIAEINVYKNDDSVLYFRLYQLHGLTHRVLQLVTTRSTGWRVLRVTDQNGLTGDPPYQGYIQISGRLSASNTRNIVDSFRYVPASMDPNTECIMYEDIETKTTAPTTTTTPTTITTTTTTTTPTTTTTTPTPTTTPTTTTPPKNLTNYYVKELFDFQKSIRISKKRIKKVVNLNDLEQLALGVE